MRWKNILYVSLFLLLILNMATTGVSAQPYVSVDPPMASISALGVTKTIEINVTDVVNLYGFDLVVGYNYTLLEVTDVTPVGPNQVVPPASNQYTFLDTSVPGYVYVGVAFLEYMGAVPFTGNGTLIWITFNGTALGSGTIDIDENETYLYNNLGGTIVTDPPVDGEIEVVPEFPAAIATLLLLIATLAATFLGKIVWPRKRRGPATT